jgi:hypothetical protein
MHNVVDAEMINYSTTGQPLKDTSGLFMKMMTARVISPVMYKSIPPIQVNPPGCRM